VWCPQEQILGGATIKERNKMGTKYKTSELIEYIRNVSIGEYGEEIECRLLELDKIKEQERKDKIRWKKLCKNKLY
jgi:hypothetical protein